MGGPLDQARAWRDLDAYCVGCPVEDFVRACRAWAVDVSAGEAELLASAYAYSMRQVKYGDGASALGRAIAEGCYEAIAGGTA